MGKTTISRQPRPEYGPLSTIDYIYRFDPNSTEDKYLPPDSDSARKALEDGNRVYASWIESCRNHDPSQPCPEFLLPWHGLALDSEHPPRQAPFAVVLGCADARAPIEMVFGQASNDLFVVRVAGNVLADVCVGSIEYALSALADSVKCVVVLGHLGCGAVTETVNAYLHPADYTVKIQSFGIRSIVEKIFTPVKLADDAIHRIWGPDAARHHSYHKSLIDVAVCVNAAQAALDIRMEVRRVGKRDLGVLYGVFNLVTHQVSMPANPHLPASDMKINLAVAPQGAASVNRLAERMAEILRPRARTTQRAGEKPRQESA